MNEKIILNHLKFASKLARIKSLSSPPQVSFEELESAAYMGLVKAAERFNPDLGFAFSSYARFRINGEMKDYMRSCLIGSKSKVRFINQGEDFEIKSSIDDDFNFNFSSFLNSRETKIVNLYYINSISMKEIGIDEGISESRVSQILNSCRKKIKKHLEAK